MKKERSPIIILNNLRTSHGEEWILRLVQQVVQLRRTNTQIARDLRLNWQDAARLRAALFEELKAKGESFFVARWEVQEQLDAWELWRRKRYEDVAECSSALRALAGDPQQVRLYTETISIDNAPGLSRAMNELRKRMGDTEFKKFLQAMRGGESIFEVGERFKRFGVRSSSVALWRKTLTRPTRALVADLAKLMNVPLELVRSNAGETADPKTCIGMLSLQKASVAS